MIRVTFAGPEFAADPSAIPVAAATLESMPRDAVGIAIFEVNSGEDCQEIDAPSGIDVHWLIHSDPNIPSVQQIDFIKQMNWPKGRVQTCIAGESSVVRSLRGYLHQDRGLPRSDTYIWATGRSA